MHVTALHAAREEVQALRNELHTCKRELVEHKTRASQSSLALQRLQHMYDGLLSQVEILKSSHRQLQKKYVEVVEQTVQWRNKLERMRLRHQQQLQEQQRAYEQSLAEHVDKFARARGRHQATEKEMSARATALSDSVRRVEAHLAALQGLGHESEKE